MGGDGGVVATNRRYMRGAGSACHTADNKRGGSASAIAEAERELVLETMKTCSITGNAFHFNNANVGTNNSNNDDMNIQQEQIVACPYGKLYGKEAAVKALLKRLEDGKSEDDNNRRNVDLGRHIRGLKDLKPVRFFLCDSSSNNRKTEPICPITSIELNGIQPIYLIVKKKIKKKKKDKQKKEEEGNNYPNVISEKAIKMMGVEALQEEYGPFEQKDMIRLAPPPGKVLDDIKLKLEQSRIIEEELNQNKSSKKKRKHGKNLKEGQSMVSTTTTTAASDNVAPPINSSKRIKSDFKQRNKAKPVDDVRQNVAAVVASSAALSSLFTDNQSKRSEKQKNDSLFSCNC